MNRACISNNLEYGYYDPCSDLQRKEAMGDVGSWIKTSILGDQLNFDYVANPTMNIRGQEDVQHQLLMYKTQQLAQSRSLDECTCSSYSSDVPHCTCGTARPVKPKSSLEQDPTFTRPELYKAIQDNWISESEYSRMQRDLQQSLAVPDPTHEYPYYFNFDRTLYDQDPVQTLQSLNPIADKSPAFTGCQRVPSEVTYNVPSPITSPVLKPPKSSRPRLCHFLLELLANPEKYSDIIEWVDREKGVFKFLKSSEVASQWGRRRNKPHMKYENFARSLRTYIAKGILTKPRSKLVYRFTSQVY